MSNSLLICGDSADVLRTFDPGTFDACVTDPPYGLGKEPDAAKLLRSWLDTGQSAGIGKQGFMQKTWDAFVPPPALWKEVFRVLKPGGHLLCFAGTRTLDYMGMALRLAEFEIRDCISWCYATGFPKSMDVSKAIDKAAGAVRNVLGVAGRSGSLRNCMAGDFKGGDYMETEAVTEAAKKWAGWGTSLKPAYEPIIVARKPLDGTVVKCVQRHGTGAINVDGCRIEGEKPLRLNTGGHEGMFGMGSRTAYGSTPVGRFPANVIHDGSPEVVAMFPESAGQLARAKDDGSDKTGSVYGKHRQATRQPNPRGDVGSAARFFQTCPFTEEERVEQFLYYCAKAGRRERNAGCEDLKQANTTAVAYGDRKQPGCLDCGRSVPGGDGVDGACPRCGSGNLGWVDPKLDGTGREGAG